MIATALEQYCSSCNKVRDDADRNAGCCRRCGAAILLDAAEPEAYPPGNVESQQRRNIVQRRREERTPGARSVPTGQGDGYRSQTTVVGKRPPTNPINAGRPGDSGRPWDDGKASEMGHRRRLSMQDVQAFYRLDDQDIATTRRSWIPVFPEGVFQHPEYGRLVFDETTIPQYIRNFRNKVRHIQPCVDIDHKNEEAAGWIAELQWRRGDGLYALVDWTTEGLSLVKDKRYRFTSAQFGDYVDEETGAVFENVISAVTLTNFPFLKRSAAIQLSSRERLMTLPGFVVNKQKGASKMPVEQATPTRYGRRADDDETMRRARRADDDDAQADDDEGMQLRRCSGCGKALDDDDQTMTVMSRRSLDDDDVAIKCRRCGKLNRLDDDQELSDDQDLEDEDQLGAGVDSSDMWDEDQSRNYARNSAQPERSDGRPTSGVRSRRQPAQSAPGYSPGRSPSDDRWGQMGTSERWLHERRIREVSSDMVIGAGVVRRARQYADEHFCSLAEAILAVSGLADGDLAGDGWQFVEDQRMARPDLLREPVEGMRRVRLAQRYARRVDLDWNDPAQKLEAFVAIEQQLAGVR